MNIGRWLMPFLVLCVAGLLLPFLVYLVWDVVIIATHDAWGWRLETASELIIRLAPVLKYAFPGGAVMDAAVSQPPLEPGAVLASLLGAFVIAGAKGLIPPFGPRSPRPDLVLGFGLIDAIISLCLGLAVTVVISTFSDWFANPVFWVITAVVLVGMLALTAVTALGLLPFGNARYAFGMMLSLGQVFLAWWAVAGWSLNSYAGSAATLLAIAGCGILQWVRFAERQRGLAPLGG